jgi:phosphopantetheine--protein transferase-like protein
MIIGIGIDSVEIPRLVRWSQFRREQLLRIFHPDELTYCFQSSINTAQRLAVRFAAREACFKALSAHMDKPVPFLTLCKAICVQHLISGAPQLIIDWDQLAEKGYQKPAIPITIHLSLTHTQSLATAFIVVELR